MTTNFETFNSIFNSTITMPENKRELMIGLFNFYKMGREDQKSENKRNLESFIKKILED